MKINRKILLVLLIFAILAIGVFVFKKSFPTERSQVQGIESQQATLVVGDQTYDISKYVGKSVLDATSGAVNGNININGSGTNAFITGINGKAADSTKHEYWELFVDGKSSNMGAGSVIVKNKDEIKWQIANY